MVVTLLPIDRARFPEGAVRPFHAVPPKPETVAPVKFTVDPEAKVVDCPFSPIVMPSSPSKARTPLVWVLMVVLPVEGVICM
jgi:hypothetical protein